MKPPIRNAARSNRREPTRSEQLLWGKLRERGLDGKKFRRQHPMGAYVLDFNCDEERLAVEVDGSIHNHTQEADALRQADIEAHGIRFVRLPARLVEADIEAALKNIRAAFQNASSGVSPLPPAGGRGAGGEG